jgi:hypothetical protein
MKYITIAALASTGVLLAGAASAQQGVDFSKVEIKTTDLGNKTYMLEGQGGDITVAVFCTPTHDTVARCGHRPTQTRRQPATRNIKSLSPPSADKS